MYAGSARRLDAREPSRMLSLDEWYGPYGEGFSIREISGARAILSTSWKPTKAYYNRYRCFTELAGLTTAQRSGAPSPPTA